MKVGTAETCAAGCFGGLAIKEIRAPALTVLIRHTKRVDGFRGRGCFGIRLSYSKVPTMGPGVFSPSRTRRLEDEYRKDRTVIATMGRARGGMGTPGLCSLAALRERTGHVCKVATGRALSATRDLCRGGLVACPEASDRCLARSVRRATEGIIHRVCRGCRLANPFSRPRRPSIGGIVGGDGIASRRTVVPAVRLTSYRLSRLGS